ncbi:HlyD family efflux transporter periplasmic adaptor subunit [Caldicellulosiruptor morganii]|uniref:HlyD family efflux transporter periplasmic adaptor subunit n=1 Tax=Caldicellulosiruptor morganii TaxID=1387555 RepID=A0ABY7BMH3_9FIRM|nr:HlyD family efflux transporter periplasmic adaptor subunit [Caldicellulosiruptor morganii]WAM34015.1 HlyD family efflux transporter periplasmic adaptor subunit [Caldicellulosiruptor morganii]
MAEKVKPLKTSKLKFSLKSKALKKVVISIAIVAILAGAGFGVYRFVQVRKNQNQTIQQRTARVTRGDITVSVTGSGPIESAQSVDLTSTVSSNITKVNFNDGDRVKKGDVIFELENQDAKDKIDSIKSQIDDVQSSILDVEDSIKNLNVTAPISGYVKNLNLSEGDRVAKGSNLLTIIDTSKLKVTLPFSAALFGKVKIGTPAVVYIPDISQSVQGTVSYLGNITYTNEYGGRVFDVEITISNPGALQEGMKASAEIKAGNDVYLSTQDAAMEYVNKENVKAKVDGEVEEIFAKNNQFVEKGALLLKLSNDDLSKQLKNYQTQLKNLQQQLKEAEDNLENYYIKAPFDGVVTNINFKKGDNIKAGEVLATIFDDKNLVFKVDIDELDIAKIKVGQKVNITVDALTDTQTNPLTGKVAKIPLEGTTQNGVTTYSVTISIDNPKDLKIGMNANAEIIVNQKQNVLMVPLEAVQKFGNRYFVFVKSSEQNGSQEGETGGFFPQGGFESSQQSQGSQSWRQRWQQEGGSTQNAQQWSNSQTRGSWSQNSQTAGSFSQQRARRMASLLNNSYYKGAVLRPVEVGINNDSYIEIVSGLSEGDIVVLPPLSTGSTSTQTQTQQGFNIMGGFGAPGGGMPGEFRQYRQFRQNQSSGGSGTTNRNSTGNQGSSTQR